MTGIRKKDEEGPRTHAFVFNGDALLILPLKRVPEETNRKVHCGGQHAISVRAFVGMTFVNLGSRRHTETPS